MATLHLSLPVRLALIGPRKNGRHGEIPTSPAILIADDGKRGLMLSPVGGEIFQLAPLWIYFASVFKDVPKRQTMLYHGKNCERGNSTDEQRRGMFRQVV